MASMATPSSQAAGVRPICFVLDDLANNAARFEFPMIIRPEDLTRSQPSRLAVHQTFGGDGAWADNFGAGLGTVRIAGHTGWRGGEHDDGQALFQRLHLTVFKQWHESRAKAAAQGMDPNLVKLIFADMLDDFTWLVAPVSFELKRNRARPLLSQFNIVLNRLADAVVEQDGSITTPDSAAGLSSLDQAIKTVKDFSAGIGGIVAGAINSIRGAISGFVKMTSAVLSAARKFIAAGMSGLSLAANAAIGLAKDLSKAAHNVMSTIAAIKSIPGQIRAIFQSVAGAFRNVVCVLHNNFKTHAFEDLSSLYGASNCSSTAGGRPLSTFVQAGTSPFDAMYPAAAKVSTVSGSAGAALRELKALDPVRGTPVAKMGDLMTAVQGGVTVAAA